MATHCYCPVCHIWLQDPWALSEHTPHCTGPCYSRHGAAGYNTRDTYRIEHPHNWRYGAEIWHLHLIDRTRGTVQCAGVVRDWKAAHAEGQRWDWAQREWAESDAIFAAHMTLDA